MKDKYLNWYKVEELNKNNYVLEETHSLQHNTCYFIKGENRAIVFDSGSGENKEIDGTKIQYQIEKLNQENIPVTLLLSHFHFDHTQNVKEFDHIALPKLKMLEDRMDGNTFHFEKKDLVLGNNPEKMEVNEWFELNQDIDLGGVIIELIHVPGHAPESIAMIDKTNKNVFLGDLIYNFSMLVLTEDWIKDYKESFDYLLTKVDDSYNFYGCHMEPKVAFKKILDAQILLTQMVEGMEPTKKDVRVEAMKWDQYVYGDAEVLILKKIPKTVKLLADLWAHFNLK